MRGKGDLDGLRRALHYDETFVDDAGEWDVGVETRMQAAEALADFKGSDVAGDLIEALEDAHPAVRLASIEALSRLGHAAALQGLVGCVASRSEDAEEVSERALELLAGWRFSGPAQQLVEKLLDSEAPALDDRHREAVERLLAADPAEASARVAIAEQLVPPLRDASDKGRSERAEQIAEWVGKPAADAVLHAMGGDGASPGMLRALGRLGDARAVDPILRGLANPDAEVRLAAAVAAGALNHTVTVGALVAATQDPEQPIRNAASAALDRMGTAAVIAAMAALSKPGSNAQLEPRNWPLDVDELPKDDRARRDAPTIEPRQADEPPRPDTRETEVTRPVVNSTPPRDSGRRRSGGFVERLLGRIE
jgi:HEAT repeat protein